MRALAFEGKPVDEGPQVGFGWVQRVVRDRARLYRLWPGGTRVRARERVISRGPSEQRELSRSVGGHAKMRTNVRLDGGTFLGAALAGAAFVRGAHGAATFASSPSRNRRSAAPLTTSRRPILVAGTSPLAAAM